MKFTTKSLSLLCALFMSSYVNASSEEAIASAEKARKAAAYVGHEWRDTALLIKQARELAAKGKSVEAIQVARLAEEQGKDALEQYRSELNRFSKQH